MKTIKKFLKKNKFSLFLFFFSTIFFILQHYFYLSWDYLVYELNAKYMFSDGDYFEILRPPLTPVLISILSIFNFYSIGRYAYLIFVSFLYLILCLKLAEKLKINKDFFYLLSLNPYVLDKALLVGTELFSLSLLMLFILFYLNKKDGGFYLGLSFLTRYNMAIFSFLILFYKKFKKIALNIFYFLIPVFIWMIYNYVITGNPLTSFADNYALNFISRIKATQPANLLHFLYVVNFMTPFILIYLFNLFNKKFLKSENKNYEINLIMFLIILITIFTYLNTPFKDVRYLFNLTLPLAYFSCKSIKKMNKKILYAVFLFFLIISYYKLIFIYPSESISKFDFEKDLAEINKLNLTNCSIRSDVWPLLAYYGYSANFNKDYLTEKYIENRYYLILFPIYGEYKYENFSQDFIIKQTNRFLVLGNSSIKCKPASKIFHSYLQGLNESIYLSQGNTLNTNPYFIFIKNEEIISQI